VAEAVRFWEIARRNAQNLTNVQQATRGMAELLYEARKLSEAIPLLESAEAGSTDEGQRFKLMRLDALSELTGTDQLKSLAMVEEIAQHALAAKDWVCYLEAVEIRIRMLERLHMEAEICRQLNEIQELDSTGQIRLPYPACLLKLVLALCVPYQDSDDGMDAASAAVQLASEHRLTRLLLRAYHRKLFCQSLRAEIHSPQGRDTVQAALMCAARGGDMRSKASIYNIVGSYYLDIRDHDNAERFLGEAAKLASAKNERVAVSCNRGVLFYSRGEYETSEIHFQQARVEAEAKPVFGAIIPFILAGLGLCALATGRFGAAKAFEATVRGAMEAGRRVPPQLVQFLSELERRRGCYEKALELVRSKLPSDRRRPLYWIKSKLIEVKYLRLINRPEADELMSQIEDEAERHGLRSLLTY
jgi:tetratricopeptide (TPR) repeat protein